MKRNEIEIKLNLEAIVKLVDENKLFFEPNDVNYNRLVNAIRNLHRRKKLMEKQDSNPTCK